MGRTLGLCLHLSAAAQRGDDIDVVVVREGKTFKGRMLGIVLGIFGKRVLGKALGTTVKAIEARNYGAKTADQT